jgi:hypothetical protein
LDKLRGAGAAVDHSRPVLVTDGGNGQNRSALSAVRALGRAGYEVHVTTSHAPSVAGWSRYCARRVPVPPVEDPAFASHVRELVGSGGYAHALAASDAALLALGWSGCELVDKEEVGRRSVGAGFPPIPEQTYDNGRELLSCADELEYPVVVKPLVRRATHDPTVWRADRPDELAPAEQLGAVVVQQYVDAPMRAVAGVIWDGRLRAVAHQAYLRTWPRDCGVACAAMTVAPDPGLEAKLPALLQGHDGVFQVQLLGDHVIDINPRVYGSMALVTRSGLNLPDLLCRLVSGEDPGDHRPLRATEGVRYRWLEGDLKHLRQSVRLGVLTWTGAARAFSPAPGTAHGDAMLTDPLPSAARLLYLFRRRRTSRAG